MGMDEKTEEFEKLAIASAEKLLEAELKKKQDLRMPFVIIPDAP
jgi:hypothetical protein